MEGQGPPQGIDQRRRRVDEANNPTRGMIHMISGGATDGDFGRARKACGRRMENFEISKPQDPIISFGPEDLRGVAAPHNDDLVVTVTIENYDVSRIFVDSVSSVNVLFKGTLDQMKIEGFELEPISTPLYGFTGHAIQPLGQIFLPVSMGNDPRRVIKMVNFTMADAPSSYNGILGRPTMKDFRDVASTYHQKLKFPVGREVGMLRGDQRVARQCYEGVVHEEGKKTRVEVSMIRGGEKLKIAADLETEVKEKLVIFLKANLDVFAWSVQELRGIKPAVMEHKLNLLSGVRPVKQKKRHFRPDKDKVIKEEIGEFLGVGHIREVKFPTWLSNVVLVPKSLGRWRMCVDFRDLNKACPKDCYPVP
ncbi:uncharacterized protein [Henckelia pumila]|uniref:uncharacterized protein n=1 Tax=Henckelia pumila TaxID=405737 RepID=UPI003C6E1FE8